jgi:heparosan-N-sulfate-glucuronate 5-epimerase
MSTKPRYLAGAVQQFEWIIRAIRHEFLEFRFDYPLAITPDAYSPRTTDYYLYSNRLFLEDLVFDERGIAMKRYRAQGLQYNPLFIAWWGLFNLQQYLRFHEDKDLQRFFLQVEWLKEHAVEREDGAVVWPCYFDWQEGYSRLRSPWISAMYQGVVISALVRAWRLRGDKELLRLCERATYVFERMVEEGGVKTVESGHILYEEYPSYPLPRVLDGFLFSLLGLYDLSRETNDPRIADLFGDGIKGLLLKLHTWNYRDIWSWYGAHGYLCPPHYHKLNYLLLRILGEITGEKPLVELAERWDIGKRTRAEKAEIFLFFILTKNWARLRLPRN